MHIIMRIIRAIRRLFCKEPTKPSPRPVLTEAQIDAKLASLAREDGLQKLDWKNSIVDLLAVLRISNTFNTRKKLYARFGGAKDEYRGTVIQNVWLIKQVRRHLARGENLTNLNGELK